MSFDAMIWAGKQDPGEPVTKLVLLGLGRYANGNGLAWPSLAEMAEFSGLERKGVMRRLDRLERAGLIEDSGQRRGHSGRVKVWRLAMDQPNLKLPRQSRRGDHLNGMKRSRTMGPLKAGNGGATGMIPAKGPLDSHISQNAAPNGSNGPAPGMIPAKPRNGPVGGTRNKSEKNKGTKAAEMAQVMDAWNAMAGANDLPQARTLTDDRRKRLKARLNEHGLAGLLDAIASIPRSPFLLGQNDRAWKASLDFMLIPARCNKLVEGAYLGMKGPGSGPNGTQSGQPKPYYQVLKERGGP